MADITMCEGTNCPVKEMCYRFTAKPDELMQSYYSKIPYDFEEGECSEYLENEQKNERNSST
jgi:hypothetical protein